MLIGWTAMKRLAELRMGARGRYGSAFTFAELSKRIGVSPRTLGSWEKGRTEPSVSQAAALARELGVTIDELMREDADVR